MLSFPCLSSVRFEVKCMTSKIIKIFHLSRHKPFFDVKKKKFKIRVILGTVRLDSEYELEYEYDF